MASVSVIASTVRLSIAQVVEASSFFLMQHMSHIVLVIVFLSAFLYGSLKKRPGKNPFAFGSTWSPSWLRFGSIQSTPENNGLAQRGDNYVDSFPPSPKEDTPSGTGLLELKSRTVLDRSNRHKVLLKTRQLPSRRKPTSNDLDLLTPTGFSLREIESLGRFPDYSVLSGVSNPAPCPDFDIEKAVFRPFRPFRWSYHQTMTLQKLEPDFWLELDNNYLARLKQRKSLLKDHGTSILNQAPGSEIACRELMEMVLQFLCIRYPHIFRLDASKRLFTNEVLQETTDLSSTNPLDVLFEHVPEDFAIMMRDENDGLYYLRAGFICSSIGWTFGTHFNRSLRAIHTEVNDYEAKMAKSMDRYFSKLPANKPIQRGAWFVEDWEPLFVTPEEYKLNGGTKHQGEAVTIEQCNLRVDWQTLRHLPLSGAVVFNFKAVFTPITELRTEPFIPSLLFKQVTDGKPSLTEPKIHSHIRPLVLENLKKWGEEQVQDGVIPAGWDEETLAESPFYPGWEERWRKRIGFAV